MKRRNRDDIGYRSKLTQIPAGDFEIHTLVKYVVYGLLSIHTFTDEFITCIISLVPGNRLIPLLQDLSRMAPQVLEDDDLASEMNESVFLESSPFLPGESMVQEFLRAVSKSASRERCIDRIREEYARSLIETGLDPASETEPGKLPESLLPFLYTDSISRIARVFSLTNEDVCIMALYFAKATYGPFGDIFNEWTHNEFMASLSSVFRFPGAVVQERFLSDRPLLKHGIIEEQSSRYGYTFSLTDTILSYLCFPGRNSVHDNECALDTKVAYSLESFHVNRTREGTVLDLLRTSRPANILLYGKEGTGKTEYARSLAQAAGKQLCTFSQEGGPNIFRGKDDLFRLSLVTSSTDAGEMILLVDEADSLLSSGPGGLFQFFDESSSMGTKARVNEILDNAKCSIIWITNRISQIDASTKRRFTYSIEFTALPPCAIREQALAKLAPFNLAPGLAAEIATLAARSGLNAASVTFLAETIAALPLDMLTDTDEARNELLARVKVLFAANTRLITGTIPFRAHTGREYSVGVLNTSVDARRIVDAVSRYYEAEERGLGVDSGLRILLYGESGTGKTEFARHVAETLGRPLLIKRASDILSPWVGVSEQQVSEAFREAEETRSILLLDEADSFFSARENTARSWERTLVNEFLTRMEEFTGVLLCATNSLPTLDRAVMRRFHETVEFYSLSADGITELLARYFPDISFTDGQILDLFVSGSYTPGDFSALRGRLNFYSGEATADYIGSSLVELSRARRGG